MRGDVGAAAADGCCARPSAPIATIVARPSAAKESVGTRGEALSARSDAGSAGTREGMPPLSAPYVTLSIRDTSYG